MKKTVLTIMTLIMTVFLAQSAFAGVVVIDPGHGGIGTEGSGAIYAPYVEKALTLSVAEQLRTELANAGVTVYMTRETDTPMSLDQRAAYAKSVGANLMVSLHFNASGPHDKTGCEVWSSAFGNHAVVGRQLGSQVLGQLSALGLESKGVKVKLGDRGDFYGLIRNSVAQGVPAIIIEHCFLDYPTDRAVLERVGTAGLAHADATAIIGFLSGGTGQSLMNGTLDVSPVSAASLPAVSGTVGAATPSPLAASFTPQEWSWLLSQWAYTGNAEAIINTKSVAELRQLLDLHAAGKL